MQSVMGVMKKENILKVNYVVWNNDGEKVIKRMIVAWCY